MYKNILVNFQNYIITQSIVAILYFFVSKVTPFAPKEMELTSIDLFFKPNNLAVWIYMSFFLLFIFGVTFTSKENSIKCCKALIVNSLIASVFFILFPTKITYLVYTPYLEPNTATYELMQLIKQYDNTSNCFPSLHIANSIVACYFLIKEKKIHIQSLSIIWLLTIIWSVLSTKQHVFYDVMGGTLVAFLSLLIILYPNKFIQTGKEFEADGI